MVITGFIAPKIGSYIRVSANRTYFKNNHYTPPWKRVRDGEDIHIQILYKYMHTHTFTNLSFLFFLLCTFTELPFTEPYLPIHSLYSCS